MVGAVALGPGNYMLINAEIQISLKIGNVTVLKTVLLYTNHMFLSAWSWRVLVSPKPLTQNKSNCEGIKHGAATDKQAQYKMIPKASKIQQGSSCINLGRHIARAGGNSCMSKMSAFQEKYSTPSWNFNHYTSFTHTRGRTPGMILWCWSVHHLTEYFNKYWIHNRLDQIQIFRVPRGCILMTLLIPWLFIKRHQQDDIFDVVLKGNS